MTTHYNIHLIKANADFKLTYRNGKFRKIEHLRGKLNQTIVDAIGKAIPLEETRISEFNKIWFQKIDYTIEVKKEETILQRCTNTWFVFYKENHAEMSPKHTGADTNALKQIIKYFRTHTTTEDEIHASWQALLDNWDCLTEFHRKQVDLKYINSKLNVIIKQIREKNGSVSTGANRSVSL